MYQRKSTAPVSSTHSGTLSRHVSGYISHGQFIPVEEPPASMKSGMFGTKYWAMHAMEKEKKKKIENEETIFGKPGHASFSVRITR